jgi:ferredoxin-type protein NapH
MRWSLGIDAFMPAATSMPPRQRYISCCGHFCPAWCWWSIFLTVAYRYGRLYCGWLCPHFSVVESQQPAFAPRLRQAQPVGQQRTVSRRQHPTQRTLVANFWPVLRADGFSVGCHPADLPAATRHHLGWPAARHAHRQPGPLHWHRCHLLFRLEFAFARHLFCRFGCAVGLFQSLAWMANPRGMVVAFDRAARTRLQIMRRYRGDQPATAPARCASSRATSSA